MRIAVPGFVIPAGIAISFFQPGSIFVPGSFLSVINIHDHGCKKRRLRASQVVSAIGVEDCSVVRDLKEEIFHHAARQVDSAVAEQSDDDETTIPAVHFIESAARHHIAIFEIKQAVRLDVADIYLSGPANGDGQMFDVNFAVSLQPLYGSGNCEFGRQIKHRRRGQLWIGHRVAAGHGTCEDIPSGGYVIPDWSQAGATRGSTALWRRLCPDSRD